MMSPYRLLAREERPTPVTFRGHDGPPPTRVIYAAMAASLVPCGPTLAILALLLVEYLTRRFRLVVSVEGYHLTRYRLLVLPVSTRTIPLRWEPRVYFAPDRCVGDEPEGLGWSQPRPELDDDADGSVAAFWYGPAINFDALCRLRDEIAAAAAKMRASPRRTDA